MITSLHEGSGSERAELVPCTALFPFVYRTHSEAGCFNESRSKASQLQTNDASVVMGRRIVYGSFSAEIASPQTSGMEKLCSEGAVCQPCRHLVIFCLPLRLRSAPTDKFVTWPSFLVPGSDWCLPTSLTRIAERQWGLSSAPYHYSIAGDFFGRPCGIH